MTATATAKQIPPGATDFVVTPRYLRQTLEISSEALRRQRKAGKFPPFDVDEGRHTTRFGWPILRKRQKMPTKMPFLKKTLYLFFK